MRRAFSFCTLLLTGAALLVPLPLLAEEAEKSDLPQFDVSMFAGQLFWVLFSFILFYFLMARIAVPKLERAQIKRQTVISTELNAATSANDSAKGIMAQYEKALADARMMGQTVVDDITAAARKESIERQAVQHESLSSLINQAEARINEQRKTALLNLRQSAIEIADEAIEKVAGLKLQVKA
jgi:F-type H+-transporting ATPase subunit b